jgi:hypothetical protein
VVYGSSTTGCALNHIAYVAGYVANRERAP